jgi:hypothetical protein
MAEFVGQYRDSDPSVPVQSMAQRTGTNTTHTEPGYFLPRCCKQVLISPQRVPSPLQLSALAVICRLEVTQLEGPATHVVGLHNHLQRQQQQTHNR